MEQIRKELFAIMATYNQQYEDGCIDSPGGLEHMGDVWRLLKRWEALAKAEAPR